MNSEKTENNCRECPECLGKGTIKIRCRFCHGIGYMMPSPLPCPNCNRGWNEEPCLRCDGKGTIKGGQDANA